MTTDVRHARKEDSKGILSLMELTIHASLDASVHDIDSILENVAQNINEWLNEPEKIVHLVAEQDGELVGVILIKEFWNLCSLFVRPDYQRRGIGKQLVTEALRECKGRSPRNAVYLFAENEALPFYRELGFIPREISRPHPPGSTPMQFIF